MRVSSIVVYGLVHKKWEVTHRERPGVMCVGKGISRWTQVLQKKRWPRGGERKDSTGEFFSRVATCATQTPCQALTSSTIHNVDVIQSSPESRLGDNATATFTIFIDDLTLLALLTPTEEVEDGTFGEHRSGINHRKSYSRGQRRCFDQRSACFAH